MCGVGTEREGCFDSFDGGGAAVDDDFLVVEDAGVEGVELGRMEDGTFGGCVGIQIVLFAFVCRVGMSLPVFVPVFAFFSVHDVFLVSHVSRHTLFAPGACVLVAVLVRVGAWWSSS